MLLTAKKKRLRKRGDLPPRWSKEDEAIITRLVAKGATRPSWPPVDFRTFTKLDTGSKSLVDMLLEDRGEAA